MCSEAELCRAWTPAEQTVLHHRQDPCEAVALELRHYLAKFCGKLLPTLVRSILVYFLLVSGSFINPE